VVIQRESKLCAEKYNVHLEAVSRSFGRSPKLRTYFASRTPALSLASKISHLFKNMTRSTFARSLLEHTDFHRRTLSSRRLILRSSTRTWSKPEIGARNIIASTVDQHEMKQTSWHEFAYHRRRKVPRSLHRDVSYYKSIPMPVLLTTL
jgi:hypothetical protein